MTQLQIGQMALAEIGTRSTVESSGTTPNGTVFNDGSEEALYLDLFYQAVRDQALRAARWNFAKRTVNLDLFKSLPGTPEFGPAPANSGWLPTYPAPPWLYSYTLPGDFLYAQNIIAQPNPGGTTPIFPVSGFMTGLPRGLKAPFDIAIDLINTDGTTLPFPFTVVLTNQQKPIFDYTYQAVTESSWSPDFVMVMVKALAAHIAIPLISDKQLAQMKLDAANQLITIARVHNANESVTIIDHVPDWLSIRGVGTSTPAAYDFYYPYGPLFTVAPFM